MIAVSERHLRSILAEWLQHYHRGRPRASLGPGIPESPRPCAAADGTGHTVPANHRVGARAVLGGLHHEYWLEPVAV
jgi:hypothetical protein